jgi:hypothetical protein
MKSDFYNVLKNSKDIDNFISNFMSIKTQIGNGVGAGKLFERIFVQFINKKTPFFSIHLNLMNSNWIWDIIISKKDITSISDKIVEICKKNSGNVENELNELLGDQWIAISLKTYKDDACQITTDYSYRDFLDTNLGKNSTTNVDQFFKMLNKHDNSKYIIIALNTDSDNNYYFRELSFNKRFEKIEFKQNRKLSQYNLIVDNQPYFKVLYGKNQANAFQRGIWTNKKGSLDYFDLVYSGKFTNNDYFENAILNTII